MKDKTKVVYKYELPPLDNGIEFSFEMPNHHKILDVQLQDGKYCMWVLVDTLFPIETVNFIVAGTGYHLIEKFIDNGIEKLPILGTFDYEHIATVQDDSYVWHIFKDPLENKIRTK